MIMKVDISWDELDNDTVLTEEEHTEKQPTAPNNEKSGTQHLDSHGDHDSNHKRIRVDDKKIINCRADLNQLVPFKYDWAWNKYLSGCANHWMPNEVNMTADIALWKSDKLSEDERTIIKRSLGFPMTLSVKVLVLLH